MRCTRTGLFGVAAWLAASHAAAQTNVQEPPSSEPSSEPTPSSERAPTDPAPSAPSRPDADELAELRARLARLEAAVSASPPAPRRERERPPPSKKQLEVQGYVQADWVVARQSSEDEITQPSALSSARGATEAGAPLNENRFLIRRSRLRVTSDQGLLHGAFEIDANTMHGPQVRPVNVEASIKWPADRPYASPPTSYAPSERPWIMVTAGLFRTPFGYETTEGSRTRPFLEPSTFSDALFPGRFDLGLRVLGGYRFLNYALGLMNGSPIGARQFPGRDPNESKDLLFRLGAAAKTFGGIRIEAGASGLTGRGFHAGQSSTKDVLVWHDDDADNLVDPQEITVTRGSPATPSQNFTRFALGADARVVIPIPVLGDLWLRGEIVRGKNLDRGLVVADPVAASRDLREVGWYVGGSQEITRYAAVGVRYDRYNPDSDAQEQRAFAIVPTNASLSTLSFMAMARYHRARLIAQYDVRRNAFGRSPAGLPTTLADNSFTLRAEMGF